MVTRLSDRRFRITVNRHMENDRTHVIIQDMQVGDDWDFPSQSMPGEDLRIARKAMAIRRKEAPDAGFYLAQSNG